MKIKIVTLVFAFFAAIANLGAQDKAADDSEMLGLPGDNLDLYATLDLFQGSKTIEEFEESLNNENSGVNNLDLDLDGKVDFIKVSTRQEGDDFTFVLQVDVLKGETQDVAVIYVSKDDEGKVSLQMVGDEALYGKDYIIEPKTEKPAVTANPAYSGPDTVVVKSQPATVVVVESEPIVEYIYSPVYVPYYSPFYYGYYPPYFYPYPVISINIYFGRHRHHRYHYHGGHYRRGGGNTVIINNSKTYNTYNVSRKTSNTVINNKKEGSYKQANITNNKANMNKANKGNKVDKQQPSKPANKPANTKPTTKPANMPSNKPANVPSTKPANRPSNMPANVPSTRPANRPSNMPAKTPSTRPASRPANKPAVKPSRRM
ncbi:hypothetical protein [Aureibacter tunicatorum]|uniref:DUF3300 domain-containing protein n=1 Tax=Aureibacter tunicatorum TaxID=866807 RepID=A0AAE3XSU1_9BACT|nr:hypothetical protein [Aureibacter tunicatorum]MDR6241365.1 hypothetical protein [Aureibacter tunicatorum]BDD06790.1 hypothetical protein AUTU_42730 [Aureibacter tunicatorum]